jgi:endonuclease/exonuclease/phosphatase family metal-dependent hydrolase
MALRILDRDESPETAGERPGPAIIPSRVWLEHSPELVRLRLMTYNVHGCRGMDGKFAPHRIARVIARERPDVVCLQEVDQERTRSGSIDQVAVIARRLRTDYRFHAVAEVDDGRFGNAVLSAHPLRLVAAGPLPAAARAKEMFNLEDRGAVWVTLQAGDKVVQIINTHLSILEQERREQAEALLGPAWLGHPDCKGPVILTGDFNASPESWALRRLETRLRNAVGSERKDRDLRTWSGRVPLRRIDHVLVSETVEVMGAYVPRTHLSRVASDHLPLVVDLVCRLGEPAPLRPSVSRH